ncbi:hypothetical protein AB0A73_01795 [Glycomyces sp. NPDC047369]
MPDVERIADRPHLRDAARTAAGSLIAAGAVVAAEAGTSVGWPLAIVIVAAALAWPAARWRRLSAKPVVAEFDREGVRLYPETLDGKHTRKLSPAVDLPWSEVRGVYFWRRRRGPLAVTMVGVEPVRRDPEPAEPPGRAAYTARFGEHITEEEVRRYQRDLAVADRRGVPAHVSTTLARRSVPFSALGLGDVEAAAKRFTVRARLVDARKAPAKKRKVY